MATLEARLNALATAVGADIKTGRIAQGDLTTLSTTAKGSLVAAINELFTSIGAAGASINDGAGNGDTLVTWSADKIFDSIEAAKTAVKNELVNGAAAALDTLSELATALGNDPSYATTIATQIANRVRFDAAQTLTGPQKIQALANIGAAASADLTALSTAVGNTDADLVAVYNTAKA